MAIKFFSDTILLLHMYSFEGFLNRFKFDEMVSIHLSRCKSSNLKKSMLISLKIIYNI